MRVHGGRGETRVSVFARCSTNVSGGYVSALGALGPMGTGVLPRHTVWAFLLLGGGGTRLPQGELRRGPGSPRTCPVCGQRFTCIYSKGSFFACRPEPACHLRSGIPRSPPCPSRIWCPAGGTSTPRPFLENICSPCQPDASNLSLTFSQVSC